jgi:3-hydroxy-3-methylglutaryl CoA synthase
MAVDAARDCLHNFDAKEVDSVLFATTTAPYKEKQGSAIIAAALDLSREIRIADFAGSLRAGANALGFGLDAIKAGTAKNALVLAADIRLGAPAGDLEQTLGDGAAALLLGKTGVIASIEDSYFLADEFSGVWRADGDAFVRSWEDRMIVDEGYSVIIPEVISGLMKKCDLAAKDISKVVFDAPPTDVRWRDRIAAKMGFNSGQVQDCFVMTIGNTGTALGMMMLVSALEEAKPGDKILFVSHGNGATAFLLQVTPAIEKLGVRRGIKGHLESKKVLTNYQTYLRWRGLVPIAAAQRPEMPPASISGLWRNRKQILGLYGVRCINCGTPQYIVPVGPAGVTPARICVVCQKKDNFEDYRFADKLGTVFSFTHDNLAPCPDPPATVVVVDFDGGGRGTFDLADREPDKVVPGMSVEMTFRKLYSDRGIHNYFWKARPIRY